MTIYAHVEAKVKALETLKIKKNNFFCKINDKMVFFKFFKRL